MRDEIPYELYVPVGQKGFADGVTVYVRAAGEPRKRIQPVAHGPETDQGGGLYQSDDRSGHLIVYFDTDDIDDSIEKVRGNGGEADEKQPIPGVGWFAGAKDSEGNAFSLFQSDESAAPPS